MFMIRNKVWPIILLAYREAFSSQLLWVLLLLVPLTLGLAELLGTMALTEKTAIKAGFSAGLTRWAALFIACLFTITSIARDRVISRVTASCASTATTTATSRLTRQHHA